MSPVAQDLIGRRIAEARRRAGLTQSDLAARILLDRSVLAKIEGGGRRVTAVELVRIADELDERIEWFVYDAPPAILSYRNRVDAERASAGIDRVVDRAARNVEFVAGHSARFPMDEPAGFSPPDSAEGAEDAAGAARAAMGLDSAAPWFGIAEHCARIGLLVFSLDLGTDTADAASAHLTRGGIAVVNGALRVGRRRLAAAHELGHFLFADEYTVDWRVADHDDGVWEARLDRFARAVLLPSAGVRAAWRSADAEGDLRTAAVKVASEFRVDMSTLARRLVELDLAGDGDAQLVRGVRTTRADIVEHNLVVHDELAPPALALPYERAVLSLYRQEVISAARATDLLFDTWDEADLPELPALPENAIWNFV